MATFTWIPDYEATENSRPRVSRVQFGDGYEQRMTFGLNTDPKDWDLVFTGRTNIERDEIRSFLRARGGVEAFTWTAPGSDPGKFVCDEWRVTLNVHNYNTITATFRQAFEP